MATLKDIAKSVGVSVPTVSLILSGNGARYRPETRQAVTRAAKRLKYRPNMAGRGLRQKKSFLLGTLFYGVNSAHMSDFLRGVGAALAGNEYAPVVFSHDTPEEEADHLSRCQHRRVDGYIVNLAVAPDGRTAAAAYGPLLKKKVPVVEIFGRFLKGAIQVNVDNAAAGRLAAEHLLAQGHRRIAMLTHGAYDAARATGVGPHFDAWEHWQGYASAMREAGQEPLAITHPLVEAESYQEQFFRGGVECLAALRAHPARRTAVCCLSDQHGAGLLRACRAAGVAVPGELAVVGFGDTELSRVTQPALTTFRMPAWEVGFEAARRLLALTRGETPGSVLLEPELLVRESVGGAETP